MAPDEAVAQGRIPTPDRGEAGYQPLQDHAGIKNTEKETIGLKTNLGSKSRR